MAKGKFNFNIKRSIRNKIYLAIILVLLIMLFILNTDLILPLLSIYIIILGIELFITYKQKDEMYTYLEDITNDLNTVTKTTIVNSPIPLLIAKTDGKILWKSYKYLNEIEDLELENKLINIIREIKEQIISVETNKEVENKQYTIKKEIRGQGRTYEIYGEYAKDKSKSSFKEDEYILTLFFIDKTDLVELFDKYMQEKLVLALIEVDNYDEQLAELSPIEKPRIMAEIEREIYNWANSMGGIVLKTDLNEFLCVFEKKALENIREDKFTILDNVKNIQSDSRNAFTLSIAINSDGDFLREVYRNTVELRNIVLGRGGDQAAIKENNEYRFYGAKTIEVEKRTRVKARVISRAIIDKIRGASSVIIMGHKNIDIDALGSAIGMYKFVKKYNQDVYIVSKLDSLGLGSYESDLKKTEIYKEGIISLGEAKSKIEDDSVLIIVDTFRKNYTEYPELINKFKEIIVIDHHRIAIDNIENVNIKYHEVYASSSSELVTEIIKYSDKTIELTVFEAESLYGGILVDTKNFTFKTGVRTFEAAAYLRKFGVDIIKVNKWFQSNLDFFTIMSEIIKQAKIYNENMAIAVYEGDEAHLISAKVADELLNVKDIKASFVIGKSGNNINISARSIGTINVQVIMEKLNGGGHITVAGTQFEDVSLEEIKEKLEDAISEYVEEITS